MDGRISEFCHVLPSWKVYPRTDYFRRRYKCLMQRTLRVIEKLPTQSQYQYVIPHLKNFGDLLDRKPRITVIGKENIDLKQMVVEPNHITTLSEELSNAEGVTAVVCHLDVFGIEQNDMKEAKADITYACRATHEHDNFFVVFDVHGSFTDQQLEELHGNLFEHTQSQLKDWKHIDRLIFGSGSTLHTKMEEFFETLIIEHILMVQEYMQQYNLPTDLIHTNRRNEEVKENRDFRILEDRIVVANIRTFLRKPVADFRVNLVVEKFSDICVTDLARVIRCAITKPIKDRYDIPLWICDEALNEIDFEYTLSQSVSKNIRYHLQNKVNVSRYTRKNSNFDFLLYPLQEELTDTFNHVKTKMADTRKRLMNASILNYEIEGYMRQATGNNKYAKVLSSACTKRRFSDIKDKFENGNQIRNSGHEHFGTLGCFVSSNDDALFALTCAHVVMGETHYMCARNKIGERKRFAVKAEKMTLKSGSSSLPLVDIAAVKVCDQIRGMCDQCLKADDGERKEAKLSYDAPRDLRGCFVYQYGATSGFQKGIVMPNDCSKFGDNANEYILNIQCLAGAENEQFAKPGDSGAVICMTDIDTNTVKAVGMVHGGVMSDGSCLAFHLGKALDELTRISGEKFNL